MQLVVPMAGAGRRFAEAGYRLPKPLIPVCGKPMVVRAVEDLPSVERTIFICHPDHIARFGMDDALRTWFPTCRIVVAPGTTDGQACSVRLAAPQLDPDDTVLVAACDNSHIYRRESFESLTRQADLSAAIWTYRGDARVLRNPQAYGWVKQDATGAVTEVSVKVPLSDRPLQDHAVSGCFWFASARLMNEAIDSLVARQERVKGEFYLDSVPNVLVGRGQRVAVFEVEKYIGWGTPEELQSYLRGHPQPRLAAA